MNKFSKLVEKGGNSWTGVIVLPQIADTQRPIEAPRGGVMRNIRVVFGLLLAIGASLILAGCQGGAPSGAGGPAISAPSSSSQTSARTRSATTAPKKTATMNGLKSYKVYNTTESLCAQTCRSESRCVTHKFSPIQTINGYVAGQCQFFTR